MKKSSILKVMITGVLLLTLVLSLGACATVTPSPTATATPAATTAAPTEAPSAVTTAPTTSETPAAPSISPIGGTLTMATNATFPPYEYQDNNQVVGIDPEIAQLIATKLGMTLQISDMEFDSIIPAVVSGKANIGMAGITVNEDRKKNVDFSDVYATGKQVIIVKADSAIASPDDLKGKKIGVQLSTTGDLYCTDDYGDSAMQRFNSGTDAVQALVQGKVDAVVIDNEPAKAYVAQNQGLKILPTDYVTEDYAIAIAKGNDTLLNGINTALAQLKASGDIQNVLNKYIKAN